MIRMSQHESLQPQAFARKQHVQYDRCVIAREPMKQAVCSKKPVCYDLDVIVGAGEDRRKLRVSRCVSVGIPGAYAIRHEYRNHNQHRQQQVCNHRQDRYHLPRCTRRAHPSGRQRSCGCRCHQACRRWPNPREPSHHGARFVKQQPHHLGSCLNRCQLTYAHPTSPAHKVGLAAFVLPPTHYDRNVIPGKNRSNMRRCSTSLLRSLLMTATL